MNGRTAPLWPIALARMAIGVMWLLSLRWKLPPDFVPASAPMQSRGLREWLQLEVQYPALPVYGQFVETVILPNFFIFAWLIFLTELFVGLALFTGTWTRVGAVIGLLLSINLGIGMLDVPGEWPWSYAMMVMWHGLFLVTAAGRLWGVDGWLHSRRSKSRFLHWLG